jgi:hypothetical protein
MILSHATHSIRQISPRKEILIRDRRSGAYPVKAKTGDRTRTGRNKIYFDDTRTFIFNTGVNVNYPTTFQYVQGTIANDLTGTLGTVVGKVNKFAIDQFISHRAQTEELGAFVESGLFEQGENYANSPFMTGSGFFALSTNFKSKVSDKTAVRLEFPLAQASVLSTISSSLHYFNVSTKKFDKIADEISLNVASTGFSNIAPDVFAPIPFTPYGFHYLPVKDRIPNVRSSRVEEHYRRLVTYNGDGLDDRFYDSNNSSNLKYPTASVINSNHVANSNQILKLTGSLAHPFLLEKIIVEFPFAAGPGWLNDCFGLRQVSNYPTSPGQLWTMDAGGPLITVSLMRQDGSGDKFRDIIASGTITNRLDMTTNNYKMCSSSYAGLLTYTDVIFSREGLSGIVNPSVVITGSVLSGSSNFYTGSVKLVMEPQTTSHVWRLRASGSAFMFDLASTADEYNQTQASPICYSPFNKRTNKYLQTGRSILGNNAVLIDSTKLDGRVNQIASQDSLYENLPQDRSSDPLYSKLKIYTDVVSNTKKSPYLLYPEDNLILCISKHRAVGIDNSSYWTLGSTAIPTNLTASHDVQIPTGSLKITLYGSLIKENIEFHDTLNQRLETDELWQDVGEDPVLDKFDVVYSNELSGSYTDRFSITKYVSSFFGLGNTVNSMDEIETSANTGLFSNFAPNIAQESAKWSSDYRWSNLKFIYELTKSNRNSNFICSNEYFWDCRLVSPRDVLLDGRSVLDLDIGSTLPQFDATEYRWFKSFPFEPNYSKVTQYVFPSKKEFVTDTVSGKIELDYDNVILSYVKTEQDGNPLIASSRFYMSESGPSDSTYIGVKYPEFIKYFYGIGDGHAYYHNNFVKPRSQIGINATNTTSSFCADIRGWKYGMMNGYPTNSTAVFRREHYGHPRDMLEQRIDTKFYNDDTSIGLKGVQTSPVQVNFYDSLGNQTDSSKTLSSNLSLEATSSLPYFDGLSRNRPEYDFATLNISTISL